MPTKTTPETSVALPLVRQALFLIQSAQVEAAADVIRAVAKGSQSAARSMMPKDLTEREHALLGALLNLARLSEDDPRRLLAAAEINHLSGRHGAALSILSRIDRNAALVGESLFLAGRCHIALGDKNAAAEELSEAARHLPHRGDLHSLLGSLLLGTGHPQAAIAALSRGIALNGNDWHTHFEIGNAHRALGNQNAALEAFSRALQINSLHAESFNNRGATLQSMNVDQQAIADFDSAIRLNAAHLFAWINKGVSLSKLGQLEESVKALETALAINPAVGDVYHNLGLALLKLEKNMEALEAMDGALLVQPGRTEWLLSKGNALVANQRYEEAIACYRECAAKNPDNTDTRINMAGALQELARHREAIEVLDEVLLRRPGYPEALWNKANSMLAFGPSQEAWEAYEQRLHVSVYDKLPDHGLPILGKEDIREKKLLVQWEQRFGDVLQMLRYVPAVSRMCDAHWQVAPMLRELVSASFPDITLCTRDECPPGLDARIPFTSLPLAMKSFATEDVPAQVPYLQPSAAARRKWAGAREKGRLNVGIAWRGNRHPPGRSVRLEEFSTLLRVSDIRFVSLQIDATGDEKRMLARHGVADLGAEIKTFDDSAALLEQLDHVVTIDTAVAHLAGALAVKTLVMLKYGADWRWLLDCKDSPWYPTATLFRQSSLGKWEGPLAEVRSYLTAEASTSSSWAGTQRRSKE